MGLCVSKSSSTRSTAGSEKSDKCRWDKHGNVFFPVRRSSSDHNGSLNTFSSTMNPVYAEYESPSARTRKGHFSSFAKLLRSSRSSPVVEHKKHPLSPARSGRSAYKELLASKGFGSSSSGQQSVDECKDVQQQQQRKRHVTLKKYIEAEKTAAASLSRSSSAKEGSLTRSSSAKEAALSRCSSQKEGKREFTPESSSSTRSTLDYNSVTLYATSFKTGPDTNAATEPVLSSKLAGSEIEENKPVSDVESPAEAAIKTFSSTDGTAGFLTKGLGLPCYQPLVFRAGSPDKCRGRSSSTHSSFSGEELGAVVPRRRSPNRKSPGRRSPRKCSPNRRSGGGGGFTLNSSAARFQRSLPGGNAENQTSLKPPQAPKNASMKIIQENRTILKELPMNGVKQVRRHSPAKVAPIHVKVPAKRPVSVSKKSTTSEKFSVYTDALHLEMESGSEAVTEEKPTGLGNEEEEFSGLLREPKSGSKRLRSPKKITTAGRYTKEYLNLNISLPEFVEEKHDGSMLPTKDKHIDSQNEKTVSEDKVLSSEEDCTPEPELLELLERTPKKLKKMALKLALMIELEHSKENEDFSGELHQNVRNVERKSTDVDLALKLGMPNSRSKRKVGDGIRLDFSVAVDSPARQGSISVPMTPRHSVTSTCNGLSVEARIGSSKSKSDFSFHILKNPDKLFGSVSRTEPEREEASSLNHVDTVAKDAAGTLRDQTKHEEYSPCRESNEVKRCSSFGFENDTPLAPPRIDDDDTDRQAPEVGGVTSNEGESTPTKVHRLDLNRDACPVDESSPAFEFKVKTSNKSSPATPIMPAAPKPTETDALSLSADEIAEIWGAFEACQEEICT